MMQKINALRREYLLSSLDENSVESDPLSQFSIWFEEAVKAETDEPNAMVLSTCDLLGNVSARVVLLKGVEKKGFVFFTNYDSRKGLQLAANPKASITFLWFALQRQVRVEGSVVKLARRDSEAYFNSRPTDSRISACVSPQSAVIPDRAFLQSMCEGFILDLDGKPPRCPDNWGGYLLKPVLIEFWQGREHRMHDRIQYRRSGNKWIVERLAP